MIVKHSISQSIGTTVWLALSFARLQGTSISTHLNKVVFLAIFLVCYISLVGITITTTLRDSAINQLIEATGHVVLRAPYATLNVQKIAPILQKEQIPLVSYMSYRYAYGCIENEKNGASSPVIFKITSDNPTHFPPSDDQIKVNNGLSISKPLATRLRIRTGENTSLHFLNLSTETPDIQTIQHVPLHQHVPEHGKSPLYEITVIVDPQITRNNDIPSAPTHMAIHLTNNYYTDAVVTSLKEKLAPIEVTPWFEMFGSIKEAIQIEKTIEFCCLTILFALGTLCLYVCSKMIILSHTQQRKQLTQWGFSRGRLVSLYILHAIFLCCAACLFALFLAAISISLLNTLQNYGSVSFFIHDSIVFTPPWKHFLLIPLSMLFITIATVMTSLYLSRAHQDGKS